MYYDVVIVGSGVAGSLCALKLIQQGYSVLILEAGASLQRADLVQASRQSARADSMAPYPFLKHAPHPDPVQMPDYIESTANPYETSYIRATGGTTWHWGGAAWRMLESDFKMRDNFGVGLNWPISYQTLEPYYQAAEVEMGVAGRPIDGLAQYRSHPFPLPPVAFSYMDKVLQSSIAHLNLDLVAEPAARNTLDYDARPACCGSNNCIPICPVGAQYSASHTLEKARKLGVNLIENAVVYQLEENQQRNITAVKYKKPDGSQHRVQGKYFVLAANAIETCKILLMSKTPWSVHGIGNTQDLVGRNLMDHPTIHAKFELTQAVYSGRGPIGISAITRFMDGDFRREYAAKKIAIGNGNFSSIVSNQLFDQHVIGLAFHEQLKHRTIRRIGSHTQHEQLPSLSNRIVLSEKRFDALGLPHPVVHWTVDDYVRKSAEHSAEIYRKIGAALGATKTNIDFNLGSNAHTLGTTIMGSQARDSVVNADCQVHENNNLFIAGGSVFTSSSSVNPTLTIAALSLRIADKIHSLIKGTR